MESVDKKTARFIVDSQCQITICRALRDLQPYKLYRQPIFDFDKLTKQAYSYLARSADLRRGNLLVYSIRKSPGGSARCTTKKMESRQEWRQLRRPVITNRSRWL